MSRATYQVQILGGHRRKWMRKLERAISHEATTLNLPKHVKIEVVRSLGNPMLPAVAVAPLSSRSQADRHLAKRAAKAIKQGQLVIPVVADLNELAVQAPKMLARQNAVAWSGPRPAARLASLILRELGLTVRARSAFISHRRSDGQAAAQQLHDALHHNGFRAFIDRFHIGPGRDVQREIADNLEQFAFLVVLETPDAHSSKWLLSEIDYALTHSMGMLIVRWPDVVHDIPGTVGIPRLHLADDDVVAKGSSRQTKLTKRASSRVLAAIEVAHADAMVRRRRMLVQSVQEAATGAGLRFTTLEAWSLRVDSPKAGTVIAITGRLPRTEDLQELDELRSRVSSRSKALLVHSARILEESRASHLKWALEHRDIEMKPEHSIGGTW